MASSTHNEHDSAAPNSRKCRFRLDASTSHTLTLGDGRRLGWAEYGAATGDAIFYLHGLPGSRLEGAGYDAVAVDVGARIVALDRPGIGLSSACAARSVRSWARDVEAVVRHLGLAAYGVLGVSGGGPYALACAAALPPARLRCVAVVCGLGPPDVSMWKADWMHWLGFPYAWRYAPVWVLEWFFRRDAFGRMDWSDEERLSRLLAPERLAAVKSDKDRRIMADEDFTRLALRATREANRQGFAGIATDGRIICSDWGFRIEEVRRDLPVQLWYGKQDMFVPPNHGIEIAARLGGAEGKVVLRLEDETHYSISQDWKREQLEAILAEMRR